MHTAIFSIITIFSLLLGGGGITVAAAQAALPDDALYSIKTWSEDFRFSLADTNEDKLDLALQFASHRMKEIKIRLEHGVVPEQALARKYQAEIETALQLATGLDTEDAQEALAKVNRVLLDQQLIMQQIQTQWQAHSQAKNTGEETQLMNQFMTSNPNVTAVQPAICHAGNARYIIFAATTTAIPIPILIPVWHANGF